MRTALLLVLGVSLFLARPVSAQIGFSPMVGYDIDYEAFTIGFGFELPVTPSLLPVSAAIRPSAEYIFIGNESAFGIDVGASVYRINADVIGRFSAPAVPVSPYAKVGVGVEIQSVDVTVKGQTASATNTEIGANLGVGVAFNSLFVEGTAGLGNISDFRFAVGFRF